MCQIFCLFYLEEKSNLVMLVLKIYLAKHLRYSNFFLYSLAKVQCGMGNTWFRIFLLYLIHIACHKCDFSPVSFPHSSFSWVWPVKRALSFRGTFSFIDFRDVHLEFEVRSSRGDLVWLSPLYSFNRYGCIQHPSLVRDSCFLVWLPVLHGQVQTPVRNNECSLAFI